MKLILLLSLCVLQTISLPSVIKIGGIFGKNEQRQELAFRYAVQSINADRRTLPNSRLQATIVRLPADDSFQASKKVCNLMRSGIAAIFGPQSENTANHVQSICDALEIPHIETRWKYKLTQDTYSVNLYPHPTSLGQAYYDILKTLKWNSFTILYDSNAGLIRLQSLLKEKHWNVILRELEGDDWRPLLKELKKTQATKFVIDVDQTKISSLLKQASQIGLMREYHSYFITSLDMHLVDMEDYRYGGTNITAIRMLDPTKHGVKEVVESWAFGELHLYGRTLDPEMHSITTESALMYDAVHLFARALDDLDRSRVVNIKPLYCDVDKTWQHGNSLINLMKWYSSHRNVNRTSTSVMDPYSSASESSGSTSGSGPMSSYQSIMGFNRSISFAPERSLYGNIQDYRPNSARTFDEVLIYGLTGLIKFDTEGFRSDFELEITELDARTGLKKVGMWTLGSKANYSRNYAEQSEAIVQKLQNRTVTVTMALTDPYIMRKETSEQLTGNDRYEGFCVDLIDRISKEIGFNYTLKQAPGNGYGRKNEKTEEWDGMIGELLNHRADLAIVDFTITYEREEIVDFSMPFMNLGISIIYKKPQKKAPSLFSFMSPFSIDVWIYMATAYLGVSVLLFILARVAPNEWDNPHPCIQDPDELENAITLSNAFWFTIGSLMQQGSDIAPKAVSTRIVAGIWWFFTLIMISSYTANLAAFLTVERMESPIEGAEDLAKQSKIKYGCKMDGSTSSFFEGSKIATYKRMWAAMNNARPTVFMETNDAGVKRVADSDGMYAFLMESSTIEYVVERNCDLMQVGGLLDAKSYGIALPPGSPYTGAISQAVLKLKESSVLHELKTKWWKQRRGGGKCQSEESSKGSSKAAELGLANVGGVFVVLIGGMGVSAVAALCEFIWNAKNLAAGENQATFCQELQKEIKFILKCSGNTKPIRKTEPSSSEEAHFHYGHYNEGTTYPYQPPARKS